MIIFAIFLSFIFQFSESPLSSWSTPQPAQTAHLSSGRSWTVAGTSLANMFPEQLRVAKRRDNDNEESGTTPTSSHHHSSPTGNKQKVVTKAAMDYVQQLKN